MPEALSGKRVIDFTRIAAGPLCATLLREMGARVIRVEFGESGDVVRTMPSLAGGGERDFFMTVNRGRKSVMLDLKTREAQKVALDLIAESDILVENFAPGVMRKLGLDYKSVRRINPGLIYCFLSGFGRKGLGAQALAFDMALRYRSGASGIDCFTDSKPSGGGSSIAGRGNGLYGVAAVLAALNRRNRTGEGQYITISMQDCIRAMDPREAGRLYSLSAASTGSALRIAN